MRGLIIGIAGLLLLASPAFGQVDTLMLVEIGQIEAPSEITNLYIEDLDGDSLKEIILTTATNIHIYNGITYEEIWTSPELVNPQDLLFEDINLDGLIDFSVKDTSNIHLLDPHNDAVIWTSPAIDSTYNCYTIGDRNDDDWIDVGIVSKEWFTRQMIEDNMDTVWVDLFDGPSYEFQDDFIILMPNSLMDYGSDSFYHSEYPKKILIDSLSAVGEFIDVFLLFAIKRDCWNGSPGNRTSSTLSGRIWVIRSSSPEDIHSSTVGDILDYRILNIDDYRHIYLIAGFSYSYQDPWSSVADRYIKYIEHSVEEVEDSLTIWYDHYEGYQGSPDTLRHFRGSIIGEIDINSPGDEIIYGFEDSIGTDYSICLSSFPHINQIWQNGGISLLFLTAYIYKMNSLYDNPQIVCQIGREPLEYRFYDGSSGSLSAIIPDPIYIIQKVADADADDKDEIFSIIGNTIYIYGLQRTPVGDDIPIPGRPYLGANYPNPFNSTTTIEYCLPQAGHVTIEIYDLLGRKVETLIDGEQEAGTYQVVWDAGNRSSGVYFYKITSAEFTETRRMVLLK